MKPIPLKDVDAYIYTSIIMPLKNLNMQEIEFGSPMETKDGYPMTFYLDDSPMTREYRRQYQRTQAQRRADKLIKLHIDGGESPGMHILCSYNNKTHRITLYQDTFRRLGLNMLFNRMQLAFSANTPFTKIILGDKPPTFELRRRRSAQEGLAGVSEMLRSPWDPDEASYDDDV